MFTSTPQFEATTARATVSRRASVCSAAWHRTRSTWLHLPTVDAMAKANVPAYVGILGFAITDAKHIGRRPGVASP